MADEKQKADETKAEEQEAEESLTTVVIMETEVSEAAAAPDGRVRLIRPGWGSSGYYTAQVLQEAVKSGQFDNTHMYWDHRSPTERRERSLRNFAGVTARTGAAYEENGRFGPGVYADVKVMPRFEEDLKAMAEHIGISIVGEGPARTGSVEGRRGPIFKAIAIESADYVTRPGAGGQITERFKQAGSEEATAPKPEEKSMPTKTEETRAPISEEAVMSAVKALLEEGVGKPMETLTEAVRELQEARIRESHLRVAESTVRGLGVPGVMEARVLEAITQDSRISEANADPAAIAKDMVEAEMRYARALNPEVGMFYQPDRRGTIEENMKAADEALDRAFGKIDDQDEE